MYTKRRVPPSEIRAGAKLAINKFQHSTAPAALYEGRPINPHIPRALPNFF